MTLLNNHVHVICNAYVIYNPLVHVKYMYMYRLLCIDIAHITRIPFLLYVLIRAGHLVYLVWSPAINIGFL